MAKEENREEEARIWDHLSEHTANDSKPLLDTIPNIVKNTYFQAGEQSSNTAVLGNTFMIQTIGQRNINMKG
jgi:hypothetical protein